MEQSRFFKRIAVLAFLAAWAGNAEISFSAVSEQTAPGREMARQAVKEREIWFAMSRPEPAKNFRPVREIL